MGGRAEVSEKWLSRNEPVTLFQEAVERNRGHGVDLCRTEGVGSIGTRGVFLSVDWLFATTDSAWGVSLIGCSHLKVISKPKIVRHPEVLSYG